MRKPSRLIVACGILLWTNLAHAHGIVGDRFFPPTITTDDPFAVDELSLPVVSYFENPSSAGNPGSHEIDSNAEFDKEIFNHFDIGISDTYVYQRAVGQPTVSGWDNLAVTAKYQIGQSEKHEFIISAGLQTDIGGTGSKDVADSFTSFVPTIYAGKGFGDLPDSLGAAKPLAITGLVGQDFPTSSRGERALQWGFAVEYSLPYLQQHVKDLGLPVPLNNMIPLVEFSMQTGENQGEGGETTGTINPGVLWEAPLFQIGAEALIPVNSRTGSRVGGIVQLQLFIDDIFPSIFGHPIFGGSS